MTTRVDTIVKGGGMAGLPMALRLEPHGKTVLIEGIFLAAPVSTGDVSPSKR